MYARSFNVGNCEIVYFRTISRGRFGDEDIMHLQAKLGTQFFDHWIKPPEPITTSEHDRFQFRDGDWCFDNIKMPTIPLKTALLKFLEFLKSSPRLVLLVSHSAELDSLLLVQAIRKSYMCLDFTGVIGGFSDSYSILRQLFPERQRIEQFTLTALARDFLGNIYPAKYVYTTLNYFLIIEQLVRQVIGEAALIDGSKSFENEVFISTAMQVEKNIKIHRVTKFFLDALLKENSGERVETGQSHSTPMKISDYPQTTISKPVAHIIVTSGQAQGPHCQRVDPLRRQDKEFNYRIEWLMGGEHSVDQSLDQDSSQALVDQDRRVQDCSQILVEETRRDRYRHDRYRLDQDRRNLDQENQPHVTIPRPMGHIVASSDEVQNAQSDRDDQFRRQQNEFDYVIDAFLEGEDPVDESLDYQDFSQVLVDQNRHNRYRLDQDQENQPHVASSKSVAHIIVSSGVEQNPHCDRIDPIPRQENEFNYTMDWLEEEDLVNQSLDYQDFSQVLVDQDSSQAPIVQNHRDRDLLDQDRHGRYQLDLDREQQSNVTMSEPVAHTIVSSGEMQDSHCDRVDPLRSQENEWDFSFDELEEGQDSIDESLDQDYIQALVDQNRLDQNQLDEDQHDQEWIQAFIQSTDMLDF